MRTQTYPEYRTSDVPWLDQVPAPWLTMPLYSVLRESKTSNLGMSESNLLSLSFGRIIRKDIKGTGGLLPESFETYQVVEPGDLVFRFTDLQNDKRSLRSALVMERGIITSAYVAVTPRGITPEFAAYLMRSYDTTKVFYGLGGGVRQSLKFDDVRRLPVLVPSPAEQRAIVGYLDRETAQIDALIGKQERLIETLRERRAAVIGHAFEDPELLAYSSSINRACMDVVDCAHTTPEVDDAGSFEAVRTGSVRNGIYRPEFSLRVSEETWQERNRGGTPTAGDVLFTREAPAGEACMVPADRAVCLGQRMVLLRIDPTKAWGPFVLWQIYSKVVQDYFRLSANGSTVGNLRLGLIRKTPMLLPPLHVQHLVADHLDRQTAKIDALISVAERLIDVSRERRSALITAAVTGQIDVRNQSTRVVESCAAVVSV